MTREDIRFYEYHAQQSELFCILPNYKSSVWKIEFNDVGNVEIHFDIEGNEDFLSEIMSREIVIIIQGEKQGILTGYQFNTEAVIYGHTLNYLTSWRTIAPCEFTEKTASEILTSIEKEFDFITLEPTSDFTNKFNYSLTSRTSGNDVIKDILDLDKGGYKIKFFVAENEFKMTCKRTLESTLLLSPAMKNLYEIQKNVNNKTSYNNGWYQRNYLEQGEWDYATKTPSINFNGTSKQFGKSWRVVNSNQNDDETFWYYDISLKVGDYIGSCSPDGKIIKLNDNEKSFFWWQTGTDKSGIFRRDIMLSATDETEAKNEISKCIATNEMTGTTANIFYGEDYELGDVVSMRQEYGKLKLNPVKFRISSVSFVYEPNKIAEIPILEKEDDL